MRIQSLEAAAVGPGFELTSNSASLFFFVCEEWLGNWLFFRCNVGRYSGYLCSVCLSLCDFSCNLPTVCRSALNHG
jgi:hypothetical protein